MNILKLHIKRSTTKFAFHNSILLYQVFYLKINTYAINNAYCFDRVINQAELLFSKVPQYEPAMLGLSKRYLGSVIEKDSLTEFFKHKQSNDVASFKESVVRIKVERPHGYCIRTGIEIPFDPKHPMCDKAYQRWGKFSNEAYKENFCHFSGEPSNGETTYSMNSGHCFNACKYIFAANVR